MRTLTVSLTTLLGLAPLFAFDGGYCNDKSTSCAFWAKNGECTGDNAEHLSTLCPHSCATCTITCNDTETACGDWAKAGHCKSNPGFMLKACPTSCGLCTPTCHDVHDDCPGWTASGACGDNVRALNPAPSPACSPACAAAARGANGSRLGG